MPKVIISGDELFHCEQCVVHEECSMLNMQMLLKLPNASFQCPINGWQATVPIERIKDDILKNLPKFPDKLDKLDLCLIGLIEGLSGKRLAVYGFFMLERNFNKSIPYAQEWARRFVNKVEFRFSDLACQRLLKEIYEDFDEPLPEGVE